MRLEQLEAKAKADTKNEHEVFYPRNTANALLVVWDDIFEYYQLSGRGEPISIDREEAIDVLADIVYKANKR